ncbi:uncharacterized protein LOC114874522 isoform X2 [Osmia bicornis bicornis]|uniref:uncharacterized protein LOC114874522 isoform X2 n=2 Tax=Osmia bicornis bicornis TaxID=1437191 RepID=UPI001EAE866C|nr:uncharacterized protein LOC114874522 isoform X2 [Osmia bicornis bicornis]
MQKTLPFSIERAFICCFVGVIFISFTEQKLETEKHQEEWFRINLTDFVDHLMPFVSKYIVENEMDPLMIPDVGQSFWIVGPLLILPSLHAELTYSFSSGSMHYLSKLERNGTVTVSYTGQTFTIDGNVVFDRILLTYDYFIKLLFLRQQGKVFADASSVWVNFRINFNILNCEFTLKAIELCNIESITISIVGGTLTELLITPFTNIVTFLIKKALMKMIEKRITELFIAHFDQMNETVCPWNIFELHRYWSKYQSSEFEMN